MTTLWRLSKEKSLAVLCERAGYWHKGGVPVVMLDPTPLAAICARLALAEVRHPRALPRGYRLMEVVVDEADIEELEVAADWSKDLATAQKACDAWLERGQTPILRLSSSRGTTEYLFNVYHPRASQCQVRILDDDAIAVQAHNFEHVLERGVDWLAVLPEPADVSSTSDSE